MKGGGDEKKKDWDKFGLKIFIIDPFTASQPIFYTTIYMKLFKVKNNEKNGLILN
jgi:hypothetical protein